MDLVSDNSTTEWLLDLLPTFKYSQHWFLLEGNRSFSYADVCFRSDFSTSCPLSIFSYFGCLLHPLIFKHLGVKWIGTLFPCVSWNIYSGTYLDIISYLFHYILHDLNPNLLFLGINLWHLICFINLPSSSNRESSFLTNSGTLPKNYLTDDSLAFYLLMNKMFIFDCLNSMHRFHVCCL